MHFLQDGVHPFVPSSTITCLLFCALSNSIFVACLFPLLCFFLIIRFLRPSVPGRGAAPRGRLALHITHLKWASTLAMVHFVQVHPDFFSIVAAVAVCVSFSAPAVDVFVVATFLRCKCSDNFFVFCSFIVVSCVISTVGESLRENNQNMQIGEISSQWIGRIMVVANQKASRYSWPIRTRHGARSKALYTSTMYSYIPTLGTISG